MRSHLVHIATEQVSNRFELIHVTAKAVRLFHRPDKRTISQSINEALERIAAQQQENEIRFVGADERTSRCQDELHTLTP